jgi:hypothetical protein
MLKVDKARNRKTGAGLSHLYVNLKKLISEKLRVVRWLPKAGEHMQERRMEKVWSMEAKLQQDRSKMFCCGITQ